MSYRESSAFWLNIYEHHSLLVKRIEDNLKNWHISEYFEQRKMCLPWV